MSNRREQIAAAAIRTIKRGGLHSVSFRTLANEVGVKSASVHYHFPTKDDLATVLVSDYTAGFQAELGEIGATPNSITYKLERLVDLFEVRLRSQDLCLCAMMAAELATLNNQTREELAGFVAATERWLTNQFEQHVDELALNLSPEQFAQLFLASLEGALLFDRIDGRNTRLSAVRGFVKALTG